MAHQPEHPKRRNGHFKTTVHKVRKHDIATWDGFGNLHDIGHSSPVNCKRRGVGESLPLLEDQNRDGASYGRLKGGGMSTDLPPPR